MADGLLSRRAWLDEVYRRAGGRCEVCGGVPAAVSAIFERRLFGDGGYYAGNGVALCELCCRRAERTEIEPSALAAAAGVALALPPGFEADDRYDRFGNPVLPDGRRCRGPLFFVPSVHEALAEAGRLGQFLPFVRHPRLRRVDQLANGFGALAFFTVIATERLTGSHLSLYSDGVHGRALCTIGDAPPRPAAALHTRLRETIPSGWRLCGVCTGNQFVGVEVWDQTNTCLDWSSTQAWLAERAIAAPSIIYEGAFDPDEIERAWERVGRPHAGWVARTATEFPFEEYARRVTARPAGPAS